MNIIEDGYGGNHDPEITWRDPEPIDKDKVVSVEMTIDELGTVIEGVMGYVAWLENTLEEEKDSNIRNISFLKSELAKCQAIYPKLDKVWWDETGAEEYL